MKNLNQSWICLGVTVWLVYLFHFDPIAAGSDRFVYLVMAMVEHHSLTLDAYRHLTTELSVHGSHYYMNTNPGLSFMALPVWAALWPLYRLLPGAWIHTEAVHFFIAHFAMFAFTSALCMALTSILLAKWIYARTGSEARALFAGCLYAFGSIAFPVSIKLNQNGVVSFVCLMIFSLLFGGNEILPVRNRKVRAALAGFFMGVALLIDYSALPFLAVIAVMMLTRFHLWKELPWAALAAAMPLGLLALYQQHLFENPFLPAQAYLWNVQQTNFSKSFLGFTAPSVDKLADYLIRPQAGIFYYMPYTLAALWHLVRLKREEGALLFPERGTIAAIFVSYLLFVSMQPSIFTAFGPRYMLPVFPLICLVCGIYSRPFGNFAVLLLFVWGFLAGIGGAELGVDTPNIFVTVTAWLIRGPWLPVLDWIRDGGLQSTGYSPASLSPYGLFLLMSVLIFGIWKVRKGELK